MAAKRGLVVMTNSLTVAQALRELENEPTLMMTGGPGIRIPKLSKGRWQNRYYAPMILISCLSVRMGLIRRVGTTTFNELVGLSRVMAEVAREVIVLVDSENLAVVFPIWNCRGVR